MKIFAHLPAEPEDLARVLHRRPPVLARSMRRLLRAPWRWLLTHLVSACLGRRNLFVVHRLFASSIGEPLCMTPIVHELHERFGWRVVVLSHHPEIFVGNPHVHRHVDVSKWSKRRLRWAKRLSRFVDGGRVENAAFPTAHGTLEECVRHTGRMDLLPRLITRHFRCRPDFRYSQCEVYLSAEECDRYARELGLPPQFGIIHSEGVTHYTPVKAWGADRFQAVVDAMPEVTFVQVGLPGERALRGCLDLRGRLTLRQLAFVVRQAQFVVCQEGVYNHMASVFGTPAFVVFSGFHPPSVASYPNTIPIVRQPQVPCSPCMLEQPCPVPGKPCTGDITVAVVVQRIRAGLPAAVAQRARTLVGVSR